MFLYKCICIYLLIIYLCIIYLFVYNDNKSDNNCKLRSAYKYMCMCPH